MARAGRHLRRPKPHVVAGEAFPSYLALHALNHVDPRLLVVRAALAALLANASEQVQQKRSPLPSAAPCFPPRSAGPQVKEEVQLAQGISALIARLDVGGLLHYGDNGQNSMCNFFRNAPSKDAWNWHMKVGWDAKSAACSRHSS